METNSAGTSSLPSMGSSDEQKGKRVLTVGYIVAQTIRMLSHEVVYARVPLGEESLSTSQWLNMKYHHSKLVDEELQKTISLTQSSESIPQGLVIDIGAFFPASDVSHGQLPDQILERWTLLFSPGSNSEPNIPHTINDKLSIVLVRSIYSFLRILPAHKLSRRCKKQVMPFAIRYSFSSPSSVNTPLSVPHSSSRPALLRTGEPIQSKNGKEKEAPSQSYGKFSFGSIVSQTGTFSASVEYKADLSMFEGSFTIAPFVISDYIPLRSNPIMIAPTVQTISAQSAPTRMGFYGSPTHTKLEEHHDTLEKEAPFRPYPTKTAIQHPVPQHTKRPSQDFFHMSPSPPSPVFNLGYISSSAPPEARPASPFIISNDTALSPSPTEDLVPEISSFYVKDKYGRRTLSISPSVSPPSLKRAVSPPAPPARNKLKEDIFFSAQLPDDEEIQFGAFDDSSESEIEKFIRMCTYPPELKVFQDDHHVSLGDDLKELRQFLSNVSS